MSSKINNHNIDLKIKKLVHNAVIPSYAHDGDAGLDLYCTSKQIKNNSIVYGTGLAFEIPYGYVGLVFPRSSLANKPNGFYLKNCVGVIDSTYRGEVTGVFAYPRDSVDVYESYNVGDKFMQMVIIELPKVNVIEVKELSETSRGTNGYGSTGT